jgi:uncharacterized membrane protein
MKRWHSPLFQYERTGVALMTGRSEDRRDLVVRLLRWGFGLYFIAIGVMHFVVPDGLPSVLDWMYELNDTAHYISGTAEILGGLGLILPVLTGIQPWLTPLAAAGLTLIMMMAIVWHATRGEALQIGNNLVIAGIMGYLAYATGQQLASGRRSELSS